MNYGERELKRGCKGPDVAELQTRLAGFRGTVPDSGFGPLTELQVLCFQRDYMKLPAPTGIADRATLRATDRLARDYPFDFKALRCPCGQCGGFGRGRFKGRYRDGQPRAEQYHLYEYPGIHRLLLWAVRAVFHYLPEHRFVISSGYRCGIHNSAKQRTSTNHHGKAIDFVIARKPGESGRDDMIKCEAARARIAAVTGAQIGWSAPNCKALESSSIAPTWIHYDVRCFEPKYLADEAFCTTLAGLNNRRPIRF